MKQRNETLFQAIITRNQILNGEKSACIEKELQSSLFAFARQKALQCIVFCNFFLQSRTLIMCQVNMKTWFFLRPTAKSGSSRCEKSRRRDQPKERRNQRERTKPRETITEC